MTAAPETVGAVPAELRFRDIPADVTDAAVDSLLDTVAVGVAGANEEVVRLVSAAAEESGDCLTFDGRSRGARAAALVNGTAAHALDFDDWLPAAGVHPSAPLLPAVLAAADLAVAAGAEVDGGRLLAAFVAGFETQARIGAAVAPHHYAAGHHPTATIGVFGAAAGAAHLLGLPPSRVDVALSIAATSAAGLRAMFGTMTKPLHAGRAAETGLLAARLAAQGFTAAADAVTGPRGFAEALGIDVDRELLAMPLEERWFLREVQFKRHASCFGTHAAVDAALGLRDTVRDAEVEQIELTVSDVLASVCAIPVPQTPLEGKFSLAFTVALALLRGRCGIRDFTPDSVVEPRLRTLAARVRLRYDPTVPAQRASIRIHLADGRVLTAAADSAVLPSPAVRAEVVRRKFDEIVGPVCGPDRSAALRAVLIDLPAGRSDHRALRRALSLHKEGDQE
ncbi:MmgE/PrpD family protein [Streptomyces sp. NPDC046805]|uniref:MmgE/PrpD family protein n=1 Tax=Streptomyces sp. NPDC046805 TaxID=3155134 RepID=UPI0033CE23F3